MTALPDKIATPPICATTARSGCARREGGLSLGDAITVTAMPLLVLFLTGWGALMGIVAALQVIPDLVLPAGALADRWDRHRDDVC